MRAIATLLYNQSYLPGALVLGHILRKLVPENTELVVLINKQAFSDFQLELLRQLWDQLVDTRVLESTLQEKLQNDLKRPELAGTFTKIQLWDLPYEKVLYLDADTLPLVSGNNVTRLLEVDAPAGSILAAPDSGFPDIFNSGVFVLQPNESDYKNLVQLVASGDPSISFDGADQGLLNQYFNPDPDWITRLLAKNDSSPSRWIRIPFLYNTTPNSQYQYLPAAKYMGFHELGSADHDLGSQGHTAESQSHNLGSGGHDLGSDGRHLGASGLGSRGHQPRSGGLGSTSRFGYNMKSDDCHETTGEGLNSAGTKESALQSLYGRYSPYYNTALTHFSRSSQLKVLHFIGPAKPWNSGSEGVFRLWWDQWFEYSQGKPVHSVLEGVDPATVATASVLLPADLCDPSRYHHYVGSSQSGAVWDATKEAPPRMMPQPVVPKTTKFESAWEDGEKHESTAQAGDTGVQITGYGVHQGHKAERVFDGGSDYMPTHKLIEERTSMVNKAGDSLAAIKLENSKDVETVPHQYGATEQPSEREPQLPKIFPWEYRDSVKPERVWD